MTPSAMDFGLEEDHRPSRAPRPRSRLLNWLLLLICLAPGIAFLSGILLLVFLAFVGPEFPFEVRERLVESKGSVTLAEVREQTTFPFPDSATNIRFRFYHTGWIGWTHFVTFTATPEDCIRTANIVWNGREVEDFALRKTDDGLLVAGEDHGSAKITVDPASGRFTYENGD